MTDPNRPEDNDADRRIDERLRAQFTPPPLDELTARVARAAAASNAPSGAPPRRIRRPALLALAAAVLAAIGLGAYAWVHRSNGRESAAVLGQLWLASFRDVEARGPGAPGCCEGMDGDLASHCAKFCASKLQLESRADLKLLGTYDGLPVGECLPLVVDAAGDLVCVFVMPRSKDPGVRAGNFGGTFIHCRVLGDVMLYEVGKSPTPRAIEYFVAP